MHVGRRLQITDGGGTVYATIASSSYSDPNTTVNLTVDSGDTVDSSISAVSYALLSAATTNPSLEQAVHLIARGSASGVSSLDFTDLSGTYSCYELIISNLEPGTDAVTLVLRTSTNNGSSFDSGASDYGWMVGLSSVADAWAGTNDQTAASISLSSASLLGNGSNESSAFSIKVFDPADASRTRVVSQGAITSTTGNVHLNTSAGARLSNTAVDAFQILVSSGNLSCDYVLLGYLA